MHPPSLTRSDLQKNWQLNKLKAAAAAAVAVGLRLNKLSIAFQTMLVPMYML